MELRILFLIEEKTNSKRKVILIARSCALTLELIVKEKYFEDLKKEFKVNQIADIAGKKVLLELETGFIYRKRNSYMKYRKSIPVPCKISIPKIQF